MREFKLIHLLSTIALTVVLTGALAAQSNTPPALQSFSFERVLDPKQVLTTLTPNLPPVVAAGVLSGALELRESMNFNPSNQVLSLNAFAVQAGAPIPTSAGPSLASSTFSIASMSVDKIYSSTSPRNALMLVGTIGTNSPISPYGSLSGAPASLSLGYTNDSPPKINSVVLSIAGSAVEYSAAATGTLTFVAPPTPPVTGTTPQIVISSPTSVYTRIADLDASNSTTGNPPLTFSWTVVNGAADIARPTAAKALAYLNGGFGQYIFRLTVTDAKGNVSTQNVTINYY
jgi:hypothetical protein